MIDVTNILKELFYLSLRLPEIMGSFIQWWFQKIDIFGLGYFSPIEMFLGGGLVVVVGYLVIRIFI